MIRRVLQRLVRLAPGPIRAVWSAVPASVQQKLAPFIHPIAAGERGGGLELSVPDEVRRTFDIVLGAASDGSFGDQVERLERMGHRVFRSSPDDDLARLAREREILDAVFFSDGRSDRERTARRLGWRVTPLENLDRFATDGVWDDLFPRVSIVVVTYANRKLCAACLAAVERNTPWPTAELIVVDNASRDGTREFLRGRAAEENRITLLENETNLGFAGGANLGMDRAQGTFVVLLNDDTVVGPGWLPRLVARIEDDPALGLVSPVTNEIGSEARVETTYRTLDGMETLAIDRSFRYAGEVQSTRMLALFCAIARREDLERVGRLDEQYEVGMFEDDDLARTLAKRGLGLAIALDSFVHHVGSASFRQLSDDEYLAIWEANKQRFELKWGVRWSPPPSSADG